MRLHADLHPLHTFKKSAPIGQREGGKEDYRGTLYSWEQGGIELLRNRLGGGGLGGTDFCLRLHEVHDSVW